MTGSRLLALGTVVMLAWSCGNGVPESANGGVAPRVSVPIHDVASLEGFRTYSGMTTRERLVIRDRAAWQSAWTRIASSTQPPVAAPEIDFAQWMVVLVAAGSRSSGGHAIEVTHVADGNSELIVGVEQVSPGPGCMTTQALTAPLHGVLVPVRAGPVRFVEHQRVSDCR